MTAHVTDTDRGLQSVAARLVGHSRVRVGILADAPKTEHEGATSTGATLVEVAAANEFGVPGHIPQRSFVRGTVDAHLDEIHGVQAALAKQIILGKITGKVAMERLGAYIQGLMQREIARGIMPENAQSTIDRKGSSKPLIDTGQLRSGISFQIEVTS